MKKIIASQKNLWSWRKVRKQHTKTKLPIEEIAEIITADVGTLAIYLYKFLFYFKSSVCDAVPNYCSALHKDLM